MIVAAGASQRLTENRLSDSVQLLVGNIHALLVCIDAQQNFRPDHQKSGGDPLSVSLFNRIMRQQISCYLFRNEAIERHVGIHGIDDPIAIAPCFAKQKVLIESVGIGIAGQIQPVPTPTLTELRRFHESVNQQLKCLRAIVFKKLGDLLRRRRQADQLKVNPSGKDAAVGIRSRLQICRFQCGTDVAIDRCSRPIVGLHRRSLCLNKRLKSPVLPTGDRIRRISAGRLLNRRLVARIRCS